MHFDKCVHYHHHNQDIEHFHHCKKVPQWPFAVSSHPTQPLVITDFSVTVVVCLFFVLFCFIYFLAVLRLCCCARAFLQLWRAGATLRCGARALGTRALVVVSQQFCLFRLLNKWNHTECSFLCLALYCKYFNFSVYYDVLTSLAGGDCPSLGSSILRYGKGPA